ncbi:MAG: hypothetical protein GTN78_16130, partial [Gemmatimonadales bacterium]|nr:hypothetical protein [Gemmatimonadales bacterium]
MQRGAVRQDLEARVAEERSEVARRYLGADIGGTNIRVGVVDDGGRIL